MRRRIAIVGYGRLGRRCIDAIAADADAELAGVVRRAGRAAAITGLEDVPVVESIADLNRVDAALVCVPTGQALGACVELLQLGVAVVECATLHGEAFAGHLAEIHRIASRERVPAVVGAGWDPGALSLTRSLFALLTPSGHTEVSWRPGVSLHHTTVAGAIDGVRRALATEHATASGSPGRIVYVELEPGADADAVVTAIQSDPLYVDAETVVVPVADVATLEEQGHGVLLERRGTAAAVAHQLLLLEGRYDEAALAATVMVAASRALDGFDHGARSLFDLPPGALWGERQAAACSQWM